MKCFAITFLTVVVPCVFIIWKHLGVFVSVNLVLGVETYIFPPIFIQFLFITDSTFFYRSLDGFLDLSSPVDAACYLFQKRMVIGSGIQDENYLEIVAWRAL